MFYAWSAWMRKRKKTVPTRVVGWLHSAAHYVLLLAFPGQLQLKVTATTAALMDERESRSKAAIFARKVTLPKWQLSYLTFSKTCGKAKGKFVQIALRARSCFS